MQPAVAKSDRLSPVSQMDVEAVNIAAVRRLRQNSEPLKVLQYQLWRMLDLSRWLHIYPG